MRSRSDVQQRAGGGILIRGAGSQDHATARQSFLAQAAELGIEKFIEARGEAQGVRFRLHPGLQQERASHCDTLQLCERFDLHPVASADDMEKEILLAMLLGPVAFEFPSYAELAASA